MNRSFLFIHNPISGGSKSNFIKIFESQKHKFSNHRIINTTHRGHAKELAAKYKNDFDVIVAVGGDGTVNEVASALVNTNTIMGIIPQGSGNGFSNHLGISLNKIKALNALLLNNEQTIDSILIQKNTFVNVAGIGFDGHITQLFNQTKSRGLWSYARLVLTEFFKFKEFDYTLRANNETLKGTAFIIALANSSQYGNNFTIAPNAKSNDGLVNVLIFKKPSIWDAPFIIWQIFKGKSINKKYGTEVVSNTLTLQHPNQPIHLDGEFVTLNTTELSLRVEPSSLQVIS